MKNIHVIPTDKPSRLWKNNLLQSKLELSKEILIGSNTAQNIYITSDEEIKEGDYFLYDETEIRYKTNGTEYHGRDLCHISGNRRYPVNKSKKIILTTDAQLIKDGVQAVEEDFLNWFVKNPSCEEVEVEKESNIEIVEISYEGDFQNLEYINYKIIIPKEDPCDNCNNDICCCIVKKESKQETLEEVPTELESVLAKITHSNDLGLSQWYEVVYYNDKWCSYSGSKTFEDGERVIEWKYCKDLI